MKNKKLTILMAEFMGLEATERKDRIYIRTEINTAYLYDPFENPAQMNAFIEHPDVMMAVYTRSGAWFAMINQEFKKAILVDDKHRPTAINKCAAAFFDEEFEV